MSANSSVYFLWTVSRRLIGDSIVLSSELRSLVAFLTSRSVYQKPMLVTLNSARTNPAVQRHHANQGNVMKPQNTKGVTHQFPPLDPSRRRHLAPTVRFWRPEVWTSH